MSDELMNVLGLAGTEGADASTETATTEAEAASRGPRTEIKIGNVGRTKAVGLPEVKRGGGFGERGSKYPFDDLVAPVVREDGETEYDLFEVLLADVENADATKLQKAVQAATAAANKSAKDAGETKYFKSFSIIKEGEYVGSSVYRTDDRPAAKGE